MPERRERTGTLFAAVFSHEPDGIAVEFPDLAGCLTCVTCGKDELEALRMAGEGQSVVLVEADMRLVR